MHKAYPKISFSTAIVQSSVAPSSLLLDGSLPLIRRRRRSLARANPDDFITKRCFRIGQAKSKIVFFCFLVLFLFATPRAALMAEADMRYETIDGVREGAFLAVRHVFENDTFFDCDAVSLACQTIASSTTFYPPSLQGENFVMGPSGKSAVVKKSYTGADSSLLTFYDISGNTVSFRAVIPYYDAVSRVLLAEDDKTVILTTRANRILRWSAENGTLADLGRIDRQNATFLTLSPNARYLAYYYPARGEGERGTHVLRDLKTGGIYTKAKQTGYWDLLSEELRLFAFSPDELRLIYLDDAPGFPTLYNVPLGALAGERLAGERLIGKSYSVADFLPLDATTTLFTANRDHPLQWSLYRYETPKGTLQKISDGASYGATLRRMGNLVSYVKIAEDGTRLAFYDLPSKTAFAMEGSAAAQNSVISEPVNIGGLSGVYMHKNSVAAGEPLFIWLHGGPHRQTSLGYHSYQSYGLYEWILRKLVEQGATVLKLDYPGSAGYGRAFTASIKGAVGEKDAEDVVRAVEAAQKKYKPERTYLLGNSYGGYLALRALVWNPKLFSGALSVSGVTDWRALLLDAPDSIFSIHFGGTPRRANEALYNQASVLRRIDRLGEQNIVLIHGDADTWVSYRQSELMYQALAEKGKRAVLVTYPEEEHVLERRAIAQDICARIFALAGMVAPESCATLPAAVVLP